MATPLPLTLVHKNCLVFLNSNFTNIYVDQEGSLYGFSNWNLPVKLTKVIWDRFTNHSEYEKLKSVVLKTLKAIEYRLEEEAGRCPLYFFMVDAGDSGAVQIPYSHILARIKFSSTFKQDSEIQNSVDKVIQIYDHHPMGSDRYDVPKNKRHLFRSCLEEEVEKDLQKRYPPQSNISLRELDDAIKLLRQISVNSSQKQLPATPPSNPLDSQAMFDFLQEKVREIATLPRFAK